MKKVLLFPLLVLGLVGFIVSCQKEPVSAPVQNVQQEETLTALDPSSLITYEQVSTEEGSVEDRDAPPTCCSVSYCGFEPINSQVCFLIQRPLYSRFSYTVTHVATGQSITITRPFATNSTSCKSIKVYFPALVEACQALPELSGNFQITYSLEVPGDFSGTWVTCASATSPSFFVAAPCG